MLTLCLVTLGLFLAFPIGGFLVWLSERGASSAAGRKTSAVSPRMNESAASVSQPSASSKATLKATVFEKERIAFTGKLSRYTREQAKSLVNVCGGLARDALTVDCTLLIVGERPGKKLELARKRGVRIMSEAGFYAHLSDAGMIYYSQEAGAAPRRGTEVCEANECRSPRREAGRAGSDKSASKECGKEAPPPKNADKTPPQNAAPAWTPPAWPGDPVKITLEELSALLSR